MSSRFIKLAVVWFPVAFVIGTPIAIAGSFTILTGAIGLAFRMFNGVSATRVASARERAARSARTRRARRRDDDGAVGELSGQRLQRPARVLGAQLVIGRER